MCGIHVHVYLGGTQIFVSQHILNGTQVGTSFHQVCGKAMAEGVRRDFLGYTGLPGIVLDEDEEGDAGEFLASGARHEDIVLVTALYLYVLTDIKPCPQLPDCLGGYGHEALLVAFAMDTNKSVVQEQIGYGQVGQFADSQSAAIQHLYDAMVSDSLRLAKVYGGLNPVDFIHTQHLRQTVGNLWRFQQFRRILFQFLL